MTNEDFNTVWMWFYNNEGYQTMTKENFKGMRSDCYSIIDELIELGFLTQTGISKGRTAYGIKLKGKQFVDGLPVEYKNRPFDYYYFIEENKINPPVPPTISVIGNNNAIGNTQSSFDRSFNAENSRQATDMPAKKKIKWDIIGLISLIVTILLWLLDRYFL